MRQRYSLVSVILLGFGMFVTMFTVQNLFLVQNETTMIGRVVTTSSDRNPSRGSKIVKTVYSDTLRFVFFAGLEGTGHHAWQSVWSKCPIGDTKRRLEFRCAFDDELLNSLYSGFNNDGGLFNPKNEKQYQERRSYVINSFKKYRANEDGIPTAVILNTYTQTGKGSGMISYPNYNGPLKPLHHGRLEVLAELAEIAQVDLRIVYLDRPAREIARSCLKRMAIIPPMNELMMLTDNAMILRTQLEMIDSNFFRCFDTLHSTHDQMLGIFKFILPLSSAGSRDPIRTKKLLENMALKIKQKKKEKNIQLQQYESDIGDGILRMLEISVDGIRGICPAS